MANSNCLEGIACPKCGSEEPFFIEVKAVVQVWDDGTDFATGEQEWDADAPTTCCECKHAGPLSEFTTPEAVVSNAAERRTGL